MPRKWTIIGRRDVPYLEAEGPALLAETDVTAIDERDVEPLVETLEEAIEMVEDWGAYASGYFQEKWDLLGDLRKLRAALKAFEDEEGSGG